MAASLQGLPSEVLVNVAGFLPQRKDVLALALTCKALNALSTRVELLALWLARQHILGPGSSLGRLLDLAPCSATFVQLLQSLVHPLSLWSPPRLSHSVATQTQQQHPVPQPPQPQQQTSGQPSRPHGHDHNGGDHDHGGHKDRMLIDSVSHKGWFMKIFVALEQVPSGLPCMHVISWLLTWAAENGRCDLVAWVLCIDVEIISGGIRYTCPHTYVFPESLVKFPFAASTTLLHGKLFMSHEHRLQSAATSALIVAAASGQFQVARLLVDHSVAQVETALAMLSEANHADALRMLILKRHPDTQQIPDNLRTLWGALTQKPPPHPVNQLQHLPAAAVQQQQPTDQPPVDLPAEPPVPDQATESVQDHDGQQPPCNHHQLVPIPIPIWGLGVPILLAETYAIPRAAKAGALATVQALLDLGVSPLTGIASASEGGSVPVLEALINACEQAGHNTVAMATFALPIASKAGHADAVRLLLTRGGDPFLNNHEALICAAFEGHAEVVEILLGAGSPATAGQGAPLANASIMGRLEVVRLLLSHGADPNMPAGRPLSGAAFNGHTEVARLLLEAGADAHFNEEEALSQAAHNGHIATARVIVEHCCMLQVAAVQREKERELERAQHVAEVERPSHAHQGHHHHQQQPHHLTAVEGPVHALNATSNDGDDDNDGDGDDDDDDDDDNDGLNMSGVDTSVDMSMGVVTSEEVDSEQQHQHPDVEVAVELSHSVQEAAQLQGTGEMMGEGEGIVDVSEPAAYMDVQPSPLGNSQEGTREGADPSSGPGAQPSRPRHWPASKLPLLGQLLSNCPNCPNRSGGLMRRQGRHSARGSPRSPGAMSEPQGEIDAALSGSPSSHCHQQPDPHDDPHANCPSTRELWTAARAELAALGTQVFSWYSIFCDGCGTLPVTGRRWRCRDCPRYFMVEAQPALQGYDLCDKCQGLEAEGKPLPLSLNLPPHPTHVPKQHTICMDLPPGEWTDLDNHAHMLVWLNCYEALHPEMAPQQLHHLAVMHVNLDPRRTRITTEHLVSLLAPGTTPQYWQDLLPSLGHPFRGACATGSSRDEVCDQCRLGRMCRYMDKALALEGSPSIPLAPGSRSPTPLCETASSTACGSSSCHHCRTQDATCNENAWPTMPPPGYVPPAPVAVVFNIEALHQVVGAAAVHAGQGPGVAAAAAAAMNAMLIAHQLQGGATDDEDEDQGVDDDEIM